MTDVCRYCGIPPGPVCGSYACIMREGKDDLRSDGYPVYDAACPACGQPSDYCQGHGPSGDPVGFAILADHDDDIHVNCDARGCDEAALATEAAGLDALALEEAP